MAAVPIEVAEDATVTDNAKTRRPSTVWGGLLSTDRQSLVEWTSQKGISKADATRWFRTLRSSSKPDYKANKTFRLLRDKEYITRQINPLFLVVQVAALESKGQKWSAEQLVADLLRLHDSAVVQPLFDTQTAIPLLSLSELHAKCLAHFAEWFTDLLKLYPVEGFINATSRADADTKQLVDMPPELLLLQQRAAAAQQGTASEVRPTQEAPMTDASLRPSGPSPASAQDEAAAAAALLTLPRAEAVPALPQEPVLAALHQLTNQVSSQQQQLEKQRDMMQAMMLVYNKQSQLASGNTAILLQLHKAQLQGGMQPASSVLPCKRSANEMNAATAQPVSKCEQRRKKQALKWEKERHAERMKAHQQQPSGQHGAQGSSSSTSGEAGPSGPLPAGMLQSTQAASSQRLQSGQASTEQDTSRLEIPGEHGDDAWQHWGGAYATLARYPSLQALYSEWEDGVLTNSSTMYRIAPLKVLEYRFKVGKKEFRPWRSGQLMKDPISDRLSIIYAILRRLPGGGAGGSFATDSPEVAAAIREVEALQRPPGAKALTLNNLKIALSKPPEQGGEIKPSKFEQTVFGWPPPSNMRKGNPKER